MEQHENGQSPLGRGKGRQALGWVVPCAGRPTPPAAATNVAARGTPPMEGIFNRELPLSKAHLLSLFIESKLLTMSA